MKATFIFLLLSFAITYAQEVIPATESKSMEEFAVSQDTLLPHSKTTFALGLGIDLGGIGGKFTRYITNDFGVFGGAGYNFIGVGYAFGIEYRFAGDSPKKFTPYFSAWYGTNASLTLELEGGGGTVFEEIYLGPSLGFGLRYKSDPSSSTAWDFGIILPFRDPDFQNDIDMLKDMGATFDVEPLPIGIKIAYVITINRF